MSGSTSSTTTFSSPSRACRPLDHLPGGLTQLALVVAAAWAYPRLRAGARAALALLFGFFGVLAGIEAVYYTFADGPSGDDFTGFLSLVAGFVLLGIGIRTLWRAVAPLTAAGGATCAAG